MESYITVDFQVKGKGLYFRSQVVKYSDKIAYVNHDIDDSIRVGLLKIEDLPASITNTLEIPIAKE